MLEASLSLFAKDGIDATSMDAIAEVSGVSKATIYKHWHDKAHSPWKRLGYCSDYMKNLPSSTPATCTVIS